MKESRVIALFGKSCVGKTEVATKLAITLSLPVRHCGELVKHRAKKLRIQPDALPEAEHKAIDDETRSLALNTDHDTIIEGSFLDVVLAEVPTAILFELTCEDNERKRRYAQKTPGTRSTLKLRDTSDRKLKRALRRTSSNSPVQGEIVSVDTTHLTPDEVVVSISEILGKPS